MLFYIDEKKEAYKFCQDNGFEPVILSITIERLNRAGEKIKADIQAEFDAENSKKKPNQEKLVSLERSIFESLGWILWSSHRMTKKYSNRHSTA
ncbi:hypothetical protein [Francisella tularensis]|uniref:hypothetical protein n=1 Tax=Francisella tularensis TaxID=263 RepID=UPI001F121DD8|nr:hypothetical protein [Francisella tularensis]